MKRNIAILSLFFATLTAQAAQFGNLVVNASYLIHTNGTPGQTVVATGGRVNVDLAQGSTKIALQRVATQPTVTATVSPTTSPTATEPTVTATPSPTAAETTTYEGNQVIVAGYDEELQKNRFEVFDPQGFSLTGAIYILDGIENEGQIEAVDLDGDDKMEVVAAGYDAAEGVRVEYWTAQGQLLHTAHPLGTEYGTENYLVTGRVKSDKGNDVVLVGRAADGGYDLRTLDVNATAGFETRILSPGFKSIDSMILCDTDGDAMSEIALLPRTNLDVVEMRLVDEGSVVTSVVLFGNGYTGTATALCMDIEGDGIHEVGAVCRHQANETFRLLVLSGSGEVLRKQKLLPGKFESQATFISTDLDGDGRTEVTAVGRMISTGSNVIQVIDENGDQILARSILDSSYNGEMTATVLDIDGDGTKETVVAAQELTTGKTAYQVVGSDGNLIGGGELFEDSAIPVLQTGDLNDDGVEEVLVLGSFESGVYSVQSLDMKSGDDLFATSFTAAPSYVYAGELL